MYGEQQTKVRSMLLSKDENLLLYKLIENDNVLLACGVVQLYVNQHNTKAKWMHRATGVLCFLKQKFNQIHSFRLYCLYQNERLWEQEIYKKMKYVVREDKEFFHMFEGDESVIGFNFTSHGEAQLFHVTVKNALNIDSKHVDNKKKKRIKVNKEDIGLPTNFQHVMHFGMDKPILERDVKQLFQEAGLSENYINNKEILNYATDFLQTHNKNMKPKRAAPSVPNRKAHKQSAPKPPSEVRNRVTRTAPPIPPSRHANTQIDGGIRQLPPIAEHKQVKNVTPVYPSSNSHPRASFTARNVVESNVKPISKPHPASIPRNTQLQKNVVLPSIPSHPTPIPPPPPPPLPDIQSIPPPPPLQLSSPLQSPVVCDNKKAATLPDDRSNLLRSIEKGIQLKHVEQKEKTSNEDDFDKDYIKLALLKALSARNLNIRDSSSSSAVESSGTSDDSEWE